MANWICRLDDESLALLRTEFGLGDIANSVRIPAEHDIPKSHLRQVAIDAFHVLARQENPNMEAAHFVSIMDGLTVHCEPARD
jgi:hypothetical protein